MQPSPDVNRKLGSIETELTVAWIFTLLIVIAWLAIFVSVVGIFSVVGGLAAPYGGGFFAGLGLLFGIIILIPLIPTFLVLRRAGRMRGAARRGDIAALKGLNSIGWAIVALIFAGVIPGVMLLVAHGPIDDL